ncbi:MAG: HAMP domain-containing sensor histidine kinase [Aeromicrobium sp.]
MKRLLPSSLTDRLVVTVVALVAVASILIGAVTTIAMHSYLTHRLDTQLEQALDRARGRTGPADPPARPPDDDRFGGSAVAIPPGQSAGTLTAWFNSEGYRGDILTTGGERKALSRSALQELLNVDADGHVQTVSLPAIGEYRVLAVETDTGTIVNGLPTSDINGTIESMIWWTTLLALGGTALAAGAGRFLVRRQLRPLQEVAATAHDVAALPLSSGEVGVTMRVPDNLTDPATEVGQVGSALNKLLGHVERALDARHESEQQVRQFVADASHELRTPLATIQGYAELTRRTAVDDSAQFAQAMVKVESEAARMSTLVDDLLLLARLDSGRPLDQSPLDLSRLLLEAADDARVVDPDRRWQLHIPGEPVTLIGDEQRLHQAITNLLANASRHTPPGTVVTVALAVATQRAGDEVVIHVHDNGPGIPAELQGRVFERFTRGDSARTRESGGAGLGMSLVHAIAVAHGGTATVESAPGDTTFSLTLPAHR